MQSYIPLCANAHKRSDVERLVGAIARNYSIQEHQEGIEMVVTWESPDATCYECPVCKKQERVAK